MWLKCLSVDSVRHLEMGESHGGDSLVDNFSLSSVDSLWLRVSADLWNNKRVMMNRLLKVPPFLDPKLAFLNDGGSDWDVDVVGDEGINIDRAIADFLAHEPVVSLQHSSKDDSPSMFSITHTEINQLSLQWGDLACGSSVDVVNFVGFTLPAVMI